MGKLERQINRIVFIEPFTVLVDLLSAYLATLTVFHFNDGLMRQLPEAYLQRQPHFLMLGVVLVVGFNMLSGVYSGRYGVQNPRLYPRLAGVGLLAAIMIFLLDRILMLGAPFEMFPLYAVMLFSCMALLRLTVVDLLLRLIRKYRQTGEEGLRTAIYGAGELGRYLAVKPNHGEKLKPVIYLDDNPLLKGSRIEGLRVAGPLDQLEHLTARYQLEQVVLAIHQLPHERAARLVGKCRELGLKLKVFGISDHTEDIRHAKLRKLDLEDLLGRKSIDFDMDLVRRMVEDKRILVTGGAGSIGSEICRQVLRLGARQLIVLDNGENGMFELQGQLEEYDDRCVFAIGSIQDEKRIQDLFLQYNPQIVFHAAAFKHVPMMEENPAEAVKNNVFGTWNIVRAAAGNRAESMILISTDKAVNPANIMGATKRIAEMIVQMASGKSTTRFCAVRFGNVLGSRGSVVPTFVSQIEQGGPVTVTHPDMRRYFMTIPEAVALVLEAGAMTQGGEIFVLDMGEPVRILDLARQMIHLMGLEPEKDIAIEFTGLRQGEKLYEEIRMDGEDICKTPSAQIFINRPMELRRESLQNQLDRLRASVYEGASASVIKILGEMVPTFAQNGVKALSSDTVIGLVNVSKK